MPRRTEFLICVVITTSSALLPAPPLPRTSERFLRDHVRSDEIFALRREATGTLVAPLSTDHSIKLNAGEKVTAEVVVF